MTAEGEDVAPEAVTIHECDRPGWEYYLDRLVAAQAGGDVTAVAWPDYEGMSGYYEPLFTDPS